MLLQWRRSRLRRADSSSSTTRFSQPPRILPGASDDQMREALDWRPRGSCSSSHGLSTWGSRVPSVGRRTTAACSGAGVLCPSARARRADECARPGERGPCARCNRVLAGQITIVLITHRMAVRRAGTILVVEDGRLVEGGDWSTLSRQRTGRFRALCEAQHVALAASDTGQPSA
jgi:hypothetical protein